MAEAAVERPNSNRFYCHQCSDVTPILPDYTCSRCHSGFIEALSDDPPSAGASPNTSGEFDPGLNFAELWGRMFLENLRGSMLDSGDPSQGTSSQQPPDQPDGQDSATGTPPPFPSADGPAIREYIPFHPRGAIPFRRTRNSRNSNLEALVNYIIAREPHFHGVHGFPMGVMHLHGNPGDYAWGAGGLDTIISQLLNQLDASGAPPADQNRIDSLPTVNITQLQVDTKLQCSICMEEFILDEASRRLPCDHHYHSECIIKWLQMHGTCPVCRKDLNGEDTRGGSRSPSHNPDSSSSPSSGDSPAQEDHSSPDPQ